MSVFPEQFVLEQQFTTKCTVGDFVATDYAKYSTVFLLQPVNTEIKNEKMVKIEMNLAKWTVTKGGKNVLHTTFCF